MILFKKIVQKHYSGRHGRSSVPDLWHIETDPDLEPDPILLFSSVALNKDANKKSFFLLKFFFADNPALT